MFHVGTSIEGLEKVSDYRLKKLAPHFMVDGVPQRTAGQVRKALKKARELGMEVIPAEGCDNYDKKGRCKGHGRSRE